MTTWATEMAQQLKVLVTKAVDLSSSPGTYVVKEENRNPKAVL